MNEEIQPGDVVALKSGSHPMTVAELSPEKNTVASVVWFGLGNSLQKEWIRLTALQKVKSQPE